jgi:sugar phosphate permease
VTSAFQKINMKRYHWNKKSYIDLNTFFYLGYGCSHLPSGIVSDKYGAKHVIEAALVSMALTSMFTPFLIVQTEGSPTVVTIIRFFLGLCEGTLMPGAVSMIAHWVPRRERATLTTIGGCGVNIGVLISQGATEIIMMKSSDWTLPFYLYGGVTLGLLLVWHLLVYSNPHRDPHINPVERFYLDTEMSESRVRLPSSFHQPLQARSSITRTRTYRSVGFYARWTCGPCL